MVNETYRYARMKIDLALQDIESSSLLFVRPSNRGKTDTAKIIVRDIRKSVFIPVISTSYQKTWFSEQLAKGTQNFIMDDPAAWTFFRKDLSSCVLVMKSLAAGEFQASRGTKFDVNIPEYLDHEVCIIIFANELQYSDIKQDLDKSGLSSRMEKFLTTHTQKHFEELKAHYRKHGYSSRKNILPTFSMNDGIDFPDEFLESGRKGHYYKELIKFEDMYDWKKGHISDSISIIRKE